MPLDRPQSKLAQPLFPMYLQETENRHVIELLEHLHVCGERLFDALIDNDLEHALQLLEERDGLVGRLSAMQQKPDDEALRPLAASLRAQNDRIADALDLRRQSLEAALEEVYRMRKGQAMYATQPARRKVLQTGLRA